MLDKIGSYEATDAFEHGVLWCAARLVEIYDEPTIAAELVREAGVDISKADKVDRPFIDYDPNELCDGCGYLLEYCECDDDDIVFDDEDDDDD